MAERVLSKLAGEAALGRAGLPRNPQDTPTLSVLAESFLERRALTNRAHAEDRYRWDKHLKPHFAHLRPAEVDAARIRVFIEVKLAEKLAAGTVRILVALLSGLFTDLVERGTVQHNPARSLPKGTRKLIKPTDDPTTVPFIEKLEDVRRIFLTLPDPVNVAYAIGALAGLRTGEVLALKWEHVDLSTQRIHVRESVGGPLKDKESRVVPIVTALYPVLRAWKLQTGGEGVVVPPMRCDGQRVHRKTVGRYLRRALASLGLSRPGLGWYEATRHTFASQWVLNGGSIEKLSRLMGHHSVVVTERYVHLRPDLFSAADLSTLAVDLTPGTVQAGNFGQQLGSTAAHARRKPVLSGRKNRSGPVSRVLSPGDFSPGR